MSQTENRVSEHLEVERKYEVRAGAVLPDLGSLPGVTAVRSAVHELSATYFDLPDLRLAKSKITLRRRTGGKDAGWHLKMPAGGDGRNEFHADLGDSETAVPAALTDRIRAWVRDEELAPTASISTHRTEHLLIGLEDVTLAEVADDTVSTQAFQPGAVRLDSWREWEVELVDGPPSIMKAANKLFKKAGVRKSAVQSKLARAIGDAALPAQASALTTKPSAGAVISAHINAQITELIWRDHEVRDEEPEGVHKMRVATRRLRSALTSFRPLFDREVTDPIRTELKWLAENLGKVRDLQVLNLRLTTAVGSQSDDLVLGPVLRRIQLTITEAHREAFAGVLETLNSERYFRLLDALDSLATDPPFNECGAESAKSELPRLVAKAWRQLAKASEIILDAHRDGTDAELHDARKAAKRARYAAEAVSDTFPKAADVAGVAEELQEILGEHQDSVVSRERLREIGIQAHLAGENAFTFGRLHGLEEAIAVDIEHRFADIWTNAEKNVRRYSGRKWAGY